MKKTQGLQFLIVLLYNKGAEGRNPCSHWVNNYGVFMLKLSRVTAVCEYNYCDLFRSDFLNHVGCNFSFCEGANVLKGV